MGGMRTRADERGGVGRLLVWLVLLGLGAAAVAAWRLDLIVPWYEYLVEDEPAAEGPAEIPPPQGLELPPLTDPSPVAEPNDEPGRLAPGKVNAALAPFLGDDDLGRHVVATVTDLATGREVARFGAGAAIPASTTKLLTGTAALAALGPETRFVTKVVAGGPGRVVLVGGGDPFLMSEPAEADQPTYPERADITTLAQLTAAKLRKQGRTQVSVGYDDSWFAGPSVNPAWPADYIPGVVSPITALWVDEGRIPGSFSHVADPSLTAAQTFTAALVAAGIEVTAPPAYGVADPGGRQLAAVRSAPVREIVERVLEVSDNEAAEVLAHQVGRAVTGTGSFVDGVTGVVGTLRELGVRTNGIEVYDGSGLSRENHLTPGALTAVLRAASDPANPDLHTVVSALPVAGFTGSLTNRFDDAFPDARGLVRAKTGTLTAVSSLAGIAVDQDGNEMVFVLMADRIKKPDETDAQKAFDVAAGALGACRCGRTTG
jgi:D-alanyl-D-alanine carboxypeptidase/D-alanyl-D-alanine-endopeptidase (penicillin-binding protein 4)